MKKEKQNKNESSEISQQELVAQAAGADLITVKARKGDNFPLLSDWEAGELTYRVVGVFTDGTVELTRVSA